VPTPPSDQAAPDGGVVPRDGSTPVNPPPDGSLPDGSLPDGSSPTPTQDAAPPHVGACNALPTAGKWERITPPGVTTSDALALDPFEIGTVWVGADPNGGVSKGAGGVFKSTDCGATWTHVNTGSNGSAVDGAHIWSLVVDPIAKGTIYVVGAYGPQGLFKSTNGGVDWVQLFPPSSQFAHVVGYNFASNVSMDPNDHNHLVVGTHATCAAPFDPVCQAESTNGGATWNIVKIPNPAGSWVERSGTYVVNATSWLYTTLASGIFLTTDHGASFKNITPSGVSGAAGGEFTHRPLSKSAGGYYYLPAFNKSGLLRSTDGLAWSVVPGVPSNLGTELCVTAGAGNVYVGDFQSGNYYVAPESDLTHWSQLPTPYPVTQSAQGPIFLEYDEAHHVLYSSDFTGGTWRIVTGAGAATRHAGAN
jgi:hypothetical protein